MLQIALIEIRASDDVVRSKQLADIFHNLPNKLAQINSEDEALQAYATLRKKSEKYGLEQYIDSIRDTP